MAKQTWKHQSESSIIGPNYCAIAMSCIDPQAQAAVVSDLLTALRQRVADKFFADPVFEQHQRLAAEAASVGPRLAAAEQALAGIDAELRELEPVVNAQVAVARQATDPAWPREDDVSAPVTTTAAQIVDLRQRRTSAAAALQAVQAEQGQAQRLAQEARAGLETRLTEIRRPIEIAAGRELAIERTKLVDAIVATVEKHVATIAAQTVILDKLQRVQGVISVNEILTAVQATSPALAAAG